MRKIVSRKDTRPAIFYLPFFDQPVEDRLLATIVEHLPLELNKGFVDLMGRDRRRDLIDVCSGQGHLPQALTCGQSNSPKVLFQIPPNSEDMHNARVLQAPRRRGWFLPDRG
jgi:hypothetical protein